MHQPPDHGCHGCAVCSRAAYRHCCEQRSSGTRAAVAPVPRIAHVALLILAWSLAAAPAGAGDSAAGNDPTDIETATDASCRAIHFAPSVTAYVTVASSNRSRRPSRRIRRPNTSWLPAVATTWQCDLSGA